MRWLAVAFAVSACSEVVVIEDDMGGRLDRYAARYERLIDRTVVLCGRLNSAATMFLSLPKACACPDAVFGFHGARAGLQHSWSGTVRIASYYPLRLREWFLREAAHLYWPQDYRTLTAKELEQMGVVKICEV
jgi:hypothetical protein